MSLFCELYESPCGLNGSGKTTLEKKSADILGFQFLNDEDYYFLKSDITFSKSRTDEEVREFIASYIEQHEPEEIEKWMNTLSCRVMKLDGSKPVDDNVEFIKKQL